MWLLTYNGTQKSFADWGLSNLRRSRVSQAQDTVSFSAPGPYDAAELFPYGAIVTISYQADSGGAVAPWFYGRVIQVPRSGSATEERMDYQLAGPWWHLDNLVYQQVWSSGMRAQPYTLAEDEIKLGEETIHDEITGEDTVYDLIGVYKSRVILGQDHAGAQRTSGQVVADVINYAIISGAPIQLDPEDPIEPDLQIPFDEQNDITCSEAIRRMLRWSPDAVTWFDYSTTPYPTFHCVRRSALQSLAIPLSGVENSISNLQIIPRPDIQVPAVVLKFEQTNTVDGVEYENIVTDKYPLSATGREFAALCATLQLAGFQTNYVTQKIETEDLPLPGISSSPEFWRAHDPSIADVDTYELTFLVPQCSADPGSDYPRELTSGQVQDWMDKHVKRQIVSAVCLVGIMDSEGVMVKEEWRTLSCEIIVTDAETRTYTKLASQVTGESIPVGLAKALYDSLNPLQYAGSVTLTEEECCAEGVAAALRAASGFTLNLTGSLVAWETMNALIQQIDEDVDSGRTTITFGPAEQLSAQDLIERLRTNRGRGVAFNFIKRTTGESADSAGVVALSGYTPILNTAGSSGRTKLQIITDDTCKITLDPAQIAALTAAVSTMGVKEVSVCDNVAGKVRFMLTIASELYDK